MIQRYLEYIDKKTFILNYGRSIIRKWSVTSLNEVSSGLTAINILDVGCGGGYDLIEIKEHLAADNVNLFGLENYPPYINICLEKGIKVFPINMENSSFPFQDKYFDLIIINQVLEHTKEIYWIFSEISRILKSNGTLIVGVPNLAALHERILLLFGMQPLCIKLLGPHMRGFTKNGFIKFVECGNFFKIFDFKGSNFWPFPLFLSKLLSRIFSTLSWSIFFMIKRTEKDGVFIDNLKLKRMETNYYSGQ
ncbi:MAG: class I SAM-dependent methyltransferase [Spirochaetota bacterium]